MPCFLFCLLAKYYPRLCSWLYVADCDVKVIYVWMQNVVFQLALSTGRSKHKKPQTKCLLPLHKTSCYKNFCTVQCLTVIRECLHKRKLRCVCNFVCSWTVYGWKLLLKLTELKAMLLKYVTLLWLVSKKCICFDTMHALEFYYMEIKWNLTIVNCFNFAALNFKSF